MQQSSRSLPRRGEGCAESREDLGRPAREEPLLLSREPKFAGRALSGDRGGNPVASPAPSKPPQLRGATRTAVLAVCLDFSLPSGTGSPPTASLALPQGRARGRELGKGFREEQRAFLGGSGRLGLPSQLLSPPWPLRVFLHPPPLCPRGRPRGSRVHVGKGASGLRLFLLLNWHQSSSKIETPGAWVQPEAVHKSPGPGALVQRDSSHTYTWLGTQVVLLGPQVPFIPP